MVLFKKIYLNIFNVPEMTKSIWMIILNKSFSCLKSHHLLVSVKTENSLHFSGVNNEREAVVSPCVWKRFNNVNQQVQLFLEVMVTQAVWGVNHKSDIFSLRTVWGKLGNLLSILNILIIHTHLQDGRSYFLSLIHFFKNDFVLLKLVSLLCVIIIEYWYFYY